MISVVLMVGLAGMRWSDQVVKPAVARGMSGRGFLCAFAVFLVCLAVVCPVRGWNYAGHRLTASIAYRELKPATRERVAKILAAHPAAQTLWANRPTNGPDPALNLFWNAAVFPDDARSELFRSFNRPAAHYVNYRIRADLAGQVEPPVDGENAINSYVSHVRRVADQKLDVGDCALRLSWMFHQVGDIHQPLHAVARFSKALPGGDRGGNEVRFPNPRSEGGRGNNLHAYWDNLLGTELDPAVTERLAEQLMREHPRSSLALELERGEIRQWAEESAQHAVGTVYRDLDAEQTAFAELPVGYEADAMRLARRQIALAGYRLAVELERLFGAP